LLRAYLLPWSRELVAVETYLQRHSLATAVSSGSVMPAFVSHVTVCLDFPSAYEYRKFVENNIWKISDADHSGREV
jgi:hypothetical protein